MSELAINGGEPVRKKEWPVMYPGGSLYDEEEKQAAIRVIEAQSPFRYYGIHPQHAVETLENNFSNYIGVKHTVACASGSMALTIALAALGVGPGTEVIIQGLFWISDINSIIQLRAIPRLAEVDETWNMDPNHLEELINERTKAIIVIHMAGTAARVEEVCEIAGKYGIPVLEDCSQSIGTTINGRQIGSFGDIATFSLQYNKTISTGEGGLISMNSDELYNKVVAFHDVSYNRAEDGEFPLDTHHIIGYGFGARMDEIRGAVGCVQLKKLPMITSIMRNRQKSIKKKLEDIKGIKWRTLIDPEGDSGTMLGWIHEDSETAAKFKEALMAEGFPCYGPPATIHQYQNVSNLMNRVPFTTAGCPWSCPFNKECKMDYDENMLPQSRDIFARSVGMPIPPIMTDEDEDDFVKGFRKVAEELL